MAKEKILVVGASGQIGVELTLALRKIYGNANVLASDLREENELLLLPVLVTELLFPAVPAEYI